MVSSIRTINQITCPICNSHGTVLYSGLSDKLFGTPGKWNFMECINSTCHIIWLDPKPIRDDLKIAYSNYFTHTPDSEIEHLNSVKKLLTRINDEYLKYKYGNSKLISRFYFLILNLIYSLHPLKRTMKKLYEIYSSSKEPGTLLDFGCGSGGFIQKMRELGWNTVGVDFDEEALKVAKKKDLEVYLYNSRELKFQDNIFDLITLNNVFEHMDDPNAIFSEIFRVLKPGGRMVISTPNKESLSQKLFKENWRGLEPPRHLQIMTCGSLIRYVLDRGFKEPKSFCRISSYYIFETSYLLKKNKKKLNLVEKYVFRLFINIFALLCFYKKDWGDLIYVVVLK